MLNGLDLFSGIGGITLALKQWVRPIAYCEIDPYCQGVLFSRMSEGKIGAAPLWENINTLERDLLPCVPDIIYGGFPCQDISLAGNGGGLEGKQSGLFYELLRVVEENKPRFVFLENVPAIRTRGLREVLRSFTDLRYDCRWTRVSAAEVGAPHIRKRWFLLAHSNSDAIRQQSGRGSGKSRQEKALPTEFDWWAAESNVGRVANGIPKRVDRIKGLGNAVVPIQAKVAFERLMGLE